MASHLHLHATPEQPLGVDRSQASLTSRLMPALVLVNLMRNKHEGLTRGNSDPTPGA